MSVKVVVVIGATIEIKKLATIESFLLFLLKPLLLRKIGQMYSFLGKRMFNVMTPLLQIVSKLAKNVHFKIGRAFQNVSTAVETVFKVVWASSLALSLERSSEGRKISFS